MNDLFIGQDNYTDGLVDAYQEHIRSTKPESETYEGAYRINANDPVLNAIKHRATDLGNGMQVLGGFGIDLEVVSEEGSRLLTDDRLLVWNETQGGVVRVSSDCDEADAELVVFYEGLMGVKRALMEIPETKEYNPALEREVAVRKLTKEQVETIYRPLLQAAPLFRKSAQVEIKEVEETGTIIVGQDGLEYEVAVGDILVLNPSDDSFYRFGNEDETVEERRARFFANYRDAGDGIFESTKPPFRAVEVPANICFEKWGAMQFMQQGDFLTLQASGSIYGIDRPSFENDYAAVDVNEG